MRYWNYLSMAEIAQRMQVSDIVVRSYLFRARNRLRVLI
ncbi:sigma factor-like helix-turn-helix DNA-binding protein [Planctomycetota bacterium]